MKLISQHMRFKSRSSFPFHSDGELHLGIDDGRRSFHGRYQSLPALPCRVKTA